MAGRNIAGEVGGGTDTSDFQGINVQYDADHGFYGGVGWYRLKDDDFKTPFYSKNGDEDTANIVSANAGYRLSDYSQIWGAYAKNTKADIENYSWQTQLEFGNYADNPVRGDWGLSMGYRRYVMNVSFMPTENDAMYGTKGFVVGGAYAPADNIGFTAKYFNGKFITGNGKAEKLYGLVEFFF